MTSIMEFCPSCDSASTQIIGYAQGAVMSDVFSCERCCILFLPADLRPLADNDNHWYSEDIFQSDEVFKKFQPPMRSAYENQCRELLKLCPMTDRPNLLDVGCGIGVFLSIAKEKNFQVHAMETSENARSALRKLGVDPLPDFSAAPQNSMDFIRASHVLEHIPQPKVFIEGCFNTLKPGGILMVIVPNGVPWIQAIVNLKRRFQNKKPKLASSVYPYMHVLGFSPKSLSYLMRERGFDQLSVKSVSMGSKMYYPWFYDGLLMRLGFAEYWRTGSLQSKIPQLLSFLGNPFGRGEWLVGYFRKPYSNLP